VIIKVMVICGVWFVVIRVLVEFLVLSRFFKCSEVVLVNVLIRRMSVVVLGLVNMF